MVEAGGKGRHVRLDGLVELHGIPVEYNNAPAGYDEESQLVPWNGIVVDRFDCRLLLDPEDFNKWLHQSEYEQDLDPSDKDENLNVLRFEDLNEEDKATSESGEEDKFWGTGTYARVGFHYERDHYPIRSYHSTPPPPPLAPAIVEQASKDEGVALAWGPATLKQMAAINQVAQYVSACTEESAQEIVSELQWVPGLEFLKDSHALFDLFQAYCSSWKKKRLIPSASQDTDIQKQLPLQAPHFVSESIRMIAEYDEDFVAIEQREWEPALDRDARLVVQVIDHATLHKEQLALLEGMKASLDRHPDSFDFLSSESKSAIIRKLNSVPTTESTQCHKIVDRDVPEDVPKMASTINLDAALPSRVDEDAKAARRVRARLLIKRKESETQEESTRRRMKAVEEEEEKRMDKLAAISQHRKMFQESDEEA